jgi:hypothetical protein
VEWLTFTPVKSLSFKALQTICSPIVAHSIDEAHAGANQRQEVTAIEPAPALLRHVERLEGHQQALAARAGAPRRALAKPHRGERRFDHVGGAQVLPVLGGEIEESHQALPVAVQRLNRLGILAWYSA